MTASKTRRRFLGLLLGSTAALPLMGRGGAYAYTQRKSGLSAGFQLVNGWILTDADVAELRTFGLRTGIS
ncbi:MAG: hypothetical protein AAGG56_03990 [Pseudomonadota bacterium]